MLKILGRNNSSNVQKVLWCCEELGVPFERTDVGGQFGGNKEPEYLAMNPNAVVPTIIEDDLILWESNSIVRYIAAKYGEGSLYPTDLRTRAMGERWMDWQLSVLGPAIFPVFWGLVRTPPEQRDEAAIAAARDKLSAAIKILDSYLGRTEFVAGDAFTVGDIPVGIVTYRWYNMDMEREDYGNLKRWYDELCTRLAFEKHIAIGLS